VFVGSEAYAAALGTPERMGALCRAFAEANLAVIPCGVDVAVYNPATDAALPTRFDAADPSCKGIGRSTVIRELGLELSLDRPLVFVDGAFDGDKGISTLCLALPDLVMQGASFVVAGYGPRPAQAAAFSGLSARAVWLDEVSEARRRVLLAASDFYLSLRRPEPTGVTLAMAARYGSVPVALAVDAAIDRVVDCDPELVTGTGLLFDTITQRALTAVVGRAVAAYRRPEFETLVRRVMRQDLSWDRAARRYLLAYRELSGTLGRSYPPRAS
jgi:starch synthase